jgi:hypothetical protein
MKVFAEYVKSLENEEASEIREKLNEAQSFFEFLSEESNSGAAQHVLDKILDLLDAMDKVEEGKESEVEDNSDDEEF